MSFNREAINTFRDSAKWMKRLEERLDKLEETTGMTGGIETVHNRIDETNRALEKSIKAVSERIDNIVASMANLNGRIKYLANENIQKTTLIGSLQKRIDKMEVQFQGLTESGLSERIGDLRKDTARNYIKMEERLESLQYRNDRQRERIDTIASTHNHLAKKLDEELGSINQRFKKLGDSVNVRFKNIGDFVSDLNNRLDKLGLNVHKLAERLGMNDQAIEAACKSIVRLEDHKNKPDSLDEARNKIVGDLGKSLDNFEKTGGLDIPEDADPPDKSADSTKTPDGWTFTFFMPVYTLARDGKINNSPTITYKTEPYYNEDKDGD